MYIRIAFSIELRLRVSRSLRSLANKILMTIVTIIVKIVTKLDRNKYTYSCMNTKEHPTHIGSYSDRDLALPARVSRVV